MVLVEREHQLSRLRAAVAEASAGRGSSIVIEGPPGIGKTALLEETRKYADEAGLRTLAAKAAELESGLGFSVVRDLFEPARSGLDSDELDTILVGAARLAAGPLGLGEGTAAPVELGAAVHGIYWLCANLAERRPLLLAVDDLHWADTPSLLALSYLTRRVAELPMVICATTRPAENEPHQRFLTAVATDASEILHPGALSDAGVASVVERILASRPAPEFTGACARATGGNPFLLVEALAALHHANVAPTADQAGRLEDLQPEALSRSVLARASRLGAEAIRVARAVAILGTDAELRRVAQLAHLDAESVAAAVVGLRREGILTLDGLDFVHPLIRTAVYANVTEPDLGLGHLTAARMLDSDGARDRVVSHLLVAERNGDPWVVERLREAATAALVAGAPASAATLLERALAEPAAASLRPELRIELGRARLRDNQLDSAVVELGRAHELVRHPADRAAVAIDLGRALRAAGRAHEAIVVLDRAVQELPDGHPETAFTIEMEIAVASHLGRPAHEWVDRLATVVGRARGPSLAERTLRGFYGYVAASTGSQDASEVARLARSSLAHPDPSDSPLMLQTSAGALAMSGSIVEALEVLDRAFDAARALGDVTQFGFVSVTRSWVAHRAGRVQEAEADAQVQVSVALDGAFYLPYAVASLANAVLERCPAEEAFDLFAQHGLDETTDLETALAASVYLVRGRLHLALGRARQAVADLERCRDILTTVGFTSPTFTEWRTDLALAQLAVGDVDSARELADEDVAISRAFGAPREIGIALRSSGLVERGPRGLGLLAESVDVLAGSEAELDHAKSLVELGAALRRAGKRSDAQERLRAGLDLGSSCGGLTLAARARDELVTAGGRPRRERLSGPDALTASELRVARLAAEGRSNSEIAQALFVTRRTVEFHLTNVFRKLRIPSREELASALGSSES